MTAPLTARDQPCPHCGLDPHDDSLHRDGCARIGTCGQFGPPWIAEPWHVTPEPFETRWLHDHWAESHTAGDPT